MAYEPKPNTGSLFINDKKQSPNQPDLRGSIHVDKALLQNLMAKGGELVEISVAAWNKQSAKGVTYLSLAASEPYVKPQETKQPWER
jgi:uncharacterized protein (DUF736 family)